MDPKLATKRGRRCPPRPGRGALQIRGHAPGGRPSSGFVLFASPVLEYTAYRTDGGHDRLGAFITDHTGEWVLDPGPLWFVEALLVFSFAYVAWAT